VVSVPFNYWGENFPQGGKVDFQVRALIGQTFEQIMGQVRGIFFDGQTGDWSATQTITIDANPSAENPDISFPYQSLLPLESQNPTSNQSSTQVVIQLGVDWMQIVTLALLGIIAVLLATVAALQLKRRKK
jgi:hypothetical protein